MDNNLPLHADIKFSINSHQYGTLITCLAWGLTWVESKRDLGHTLDRDDQTLLALSMDANNALLVPIYKSVLQQTTHSRELFFSQQQSCTDWAMSVLSESMAQFDVK